MKTMMMLTMTLFFFAYSHADAQKLATLTGIPAEGPVKSAGAVAKWDKTVEDMGEIAQGTPKAAEFKLTNDGAEPLLIASAHASCGCTNLSYPKDPVLPGKSATISVTYNAAARGAFMKTVTVRTNAGDQPTLLQVKGVVLERTVAVKQ